eukprot:288208-Pelagomonas_calceolata.AAC.4
MQLVQLQFKLQKILAPYIAAKRAQVDFNHPKLHSRHDKNYLQFLLARWTNTRRFQLLANPELLCLQAQVRQRCGERILHFCALNQKGAAESALVSDLMKAICNSQARSFYLALQHHHLLPSCDSSTSLQFYCNACNFSTLWVFSIVHHKNNCDKRGVIFATFRLQ